MGKVGQVFHPEQDRIVSVRECARSQVGSQLPSERGTMVFAKESEKGKTQGCRGRALGSQQRMMSAQTGTIRPWQAMLAMPGKEALCHAHQVAASDGAHMICAPGIYAHA